MWFSNRNIFMILFSKTNFGYVGRLLLLIWEPFSVLIPNMRTFRYIENLWFWNENLFRFYFPTWEPSDTMRTLDVETRTFFGSTFQHGNLSIQWEPLMLEREPFSVLISITKGFALTRTLKGSRSEPSGWMKTRPGAQGGLGSWKGNQFLCISNDPMYIPLHGTRPLAGILWWVWPGEQLKCYPWNDLD